VSDHSLILRHSSKQSKYQMENSDDCYDDLPEDITIKYVIDYQKFKKKVPSKQYENRSDTIHSQLRLDAGRCKIVLNGNSNFIVSSPLDTVPASDIAYYLTPQPQEECAICLEDYTAPRLLPCGHMYCFVCLKMTYQPLITYQYCVICSSTYELIDVKPVFWQQSPKNVNHFDTSLFFPDWNSAQEPENNRFPPLFLFKKDEKTGFVECQSNHFKAAEKNRFYKRILTCSDDSELLTETEALILDYLALFDALKKDLSAKVLSVDLVTAYFEAIYDILESFSTFCIVDIQVINTGSKEGCLELLAEILKPRIIGSEPDDGLADSKYKIKNRHWEDELFINKKIDQIIPTIAIKCSFEKLNNIFSVLLQMYDVDPNQSFYLKPSSLLKRLNVTMNMRSSRVVKFNQSIEDAEQNSFFEMIDKSSARTNDDHKSCDSKNMWEDDPAKSFDEIRSFLNKRNKLNKYTEKWSYRCLPDTQSWTFSILKECVVQIVLDAILSWAKEITKDALPDLDLILTTMAESWPPPDSEIAKYLPSVLYPTAIERLRNGTIPDTISIVYGKIKMTDFNQTPQLATLVWDAPGRNFILLDCDAPYLRNSHEVNVILNDRIQRMNMERKHQAYRVLKDEARIADDDQHETAANNLEVLFGASVAKLRQHRNQLPDTLNTKDDLKLSDDEEFPTLGMYLQD